jgi:hypothetical protein
MRPSIAARIRAHLLRTLALRTALPAALWFIGLTVAQAQMHAPAPAPSPFHLTIDAATLAGLARQTMTVTDDKGHTNTYSGFSLHDLLVRAGAPDGEALRGKALTSYVVVGASDGYRVIFTLPELDPSFTDHVVLVADMRDGAPLGSDIGPYRLVVPFEKKGARWVRQVTDIELENAPAP